MQVVIPAAGMGNRLGKYTSDKTKCMVEVHNVTLIERCLSILSKYDISRIVLVVGYHKNKLKELLGNSYNGIEIIYIDNDIYDKTNNIYSIYLAKDELVKDDTILLESDLIFEEKIIENLVSNQFPNIAVVDKYQPWMDGTVVEINNNFDIVNFVPKKDFEFSKSDSYYKTVNIYKFSKEFLENTYVPFLEAYSKALGQNEYYEQVLRVITLLETQELKALPLQGEKWYEIDDAQDLDNANVIFAPKEEKLSLLSRRYGGYWRYSDIIDFCYLVNPYFPNKTFMGEMKNSFDTLVREYPSGANVQSLLAAKMFKCAPDQIAVGNGAAELIDILAQYKNEKLGLFIPTFEEYSSRFKSVTLQKLNNQNFTYDRNDIIKLAQENDGVILINPDNPSGNFIPYKDLIELIDWFKVNKKTFIVDESFVDFAENGLDSTLMKEEILNLYSGLIVIKSISKSYGVPGIRLGVIASSNTELISLIKKSIPVWNINSLGEFFLQIIGKYEKVYASACKQIITERNSLFSALSKNKLLTPIKSQANYILCKVSLISSTELIEILCTEYNILAKDCAEKKGFDNQPYIRLAVRDSVDNQHLIDSLLEIESKVK
ncbi:MULTISPECIES: aminotransferase class I/II-fold pyridoxal phosphate-dependent enzyme [Providencia]|uniref:aminotransferase class I/II-fold pyridoxal phosphate-dependent enzyme n=1 Tax=Providencia TaxID=586 RepID=UPI0008FB178D|nr:MULTISPECIES: aminotransferase class I/II-fold pyridoxal phosphate-dependent enzyme [Providencia]APC14019.1 Threonine-phosphate decarboxylase [Providencia rettgeri]AVL73309.1 aminotransferase [Providencia rettgeri]EKH6495458.1 aminotransferase class I/II-fold pyridoxal phosphate-dependent enzyme [Providencia rettgeri]ELR5052727.1 aminotransferase class I/II-fold pyridoxal phosphate-dependent enzyme [Providencia rettgeri]ELR5154075.1 aminotransferase class I/II-fold pyridoxal phosphate-depen